MSGPLRENEPDTQFPPSLSIARSFGLKPFLVVADLAGGWAMVDGDEARCRGGITEETKADEESERTPMKSSKVEEDGDCSKHDGGRGRRGGSEGRHDHLKLVEFL